MIKLIIVGRGAPDKSREAAHRHMREVHGPMVYAPPPDAGAMPCYYAQNPAFDDEGVLPAPWRGQRDFVTEIGFDDIPHLKAATSTPYYLTQLRPDEPNFVDPPSVSAAPTREERRGGSETSRPARLFLFLTSRAGAGDLARACALALEDLARDAAVAAWASDVALPAPDGRASPFERVERFSFPDRETALDFARRRFTGLAERLAPHVEADNSFAVFADHHSVARLRADNGEPT